MLHVSGTLRAPGWWACRVRRGPPQRPGARAPPVWRTQEVVLYFRSHRGLCTKPGGRRCLCQPGSLAVGQPHCARRPALRPGAAAAGEGTRHPDTPPPQSVTPRCPCSPWSGSGLPIWRDAVAFSLAFQGWQGMGRGEASTPRMCGSDPWRIFTERLCVGGCGPWG